LTPLHHAAAQGQSDVLTLLLSAGASLSVVDKQVKYSQTTQLYITKVFEKNSVVMIT
jgi:ankyrin repeat protein